MITSSDLIEIPVPDEVIASATNLVKHMLLSQKIPHQTNPITILTLRNLALHISTNLLFRRYLSQNQIPFTISNGSQGGEELWPTIAIGGRRCNMNCRFSAKPEWDVDDEPNPTSLLKEDISLPKHHDALKNDGRETIEVFSALIVDSKRANLSIGELAKRGENLFLINILENMHEINWEAAGGQIEFYYEGENDLILEVGGLDEKFNPITESIHFGFHKRAFTKSVFSRVIYLTANTLPEKSISLSLGAAKKIFLPVSSWGSLWLRVTTCVFFGFLHSTDLRQRFDKLIRTNTSYRINWFRTEKHKISVLELNPLPKLFGIAKMIDQPKQ